MENPEIILGDLLASDAWMRSLARRLMLDRDAADDVSQDTWVAALQNPPHERDAVRSWLARVVRRAAWSRRCTDDRRRVREQAAARPESTPSVAEIRDRESARYRVAKAVFSLEEPYRSAVFYRYFEDMPPRDIASRLEVSAQAVEGRLRRGIEKLRARLDRDFGDRRSWCAALLPLISTAPVEAAAASALSGALVMSTKMKIGIAILVVLGAVVAYWPRGEEGTSHEAAGRPAVSGAQSVLAVDDETSADASTVPLARSPADPPASPVARTAASTILKGRCVAAATGLPLAGCTVTLTGNPGDNVEVEDHVVRHGQIRWKAPDARVTGADGCFSFTITPPRPYTFMLEVTRPDRVPMTAVWPSLERGEIEDLGDVSMRTGVPLMLHVVDTAGVPQAGARGQLWRRPSPRGEGAVPGRHVTLLTDANGVARCTHPILPGAWRVSLTNRKLEGPVEIRVPEHVAGHSRELVVRRSRTLTGVVLDEAGRPVAGASVSIHPESSLAGFRAVTGGDGSFRIEPSSKVPVAPVALSVVKDGYDILRGYGAYPMGSAKVRLVIRRGLPVEIGVFDGLTGTSVEGFGVRCFLEARPGRFLHDDPKRLRHPGRHKGGVLTLPAVRRGTNLVMVEPLDAKVASSPWIRVEVGDSGPASCRVRLWPSTERRLHVVDAQGRALAGTEIELLRPAGGEPVRLDSLAGTPSLLRYNRHDKLCILLQHGTTDERGEVLLSGPANERLAVRLLGPGHLPRVLNEVVLDPALGPLRVEVDTASRVSGVLRPLEALSRLGPMAAGWKHAARRGRPVRSTRSAHRPAVRLALDAPRPAGKGKSPASLHAIVGEDGTFCFAGVPPGTWRVALHYSLLRGDGTGRMHRRKELGRVRGLRWGEKRDVVYDISGLCPTRLTGTVFLNGRPLGKEAVSFPAVRTDRNGRSRLVTTNLSASTDARGAFSIDLEPGLYRLRMENRRSGGRGAAVVSHTIEIPSGQDICHDFRLVSARLEFRVLGADGKTPVRGVSLYAAIPAQHWRFYAPKSDHEGRIILDRVPQGAVMFTVWPKHIQSSEDRHRFKQKHPRSWRARLPSLGTIEIPAGTSRITKDLVMPPEAGY